MKTEAFSKLLLWLFVIDLGIAFGAGLYEHRIVVSHWIGVSPDSTFFWDAEAARQDDTGRRFWAFVTTLPLTLLTFGNLIAGWCTRGAVRAWWLGASLAALADRILTFAYFIPTMIGLLRAANSPDAVAIATQWQHLNYVRHAIVLVAWLAALRAFSLLYQHQRGTS